jgi:hypothetical protein
LPRRPRDWAAHPCTRPTIGVAFRDGFKSITTGAAFVPDKILIDIIDEHLPYEIDMLRLIYKELESLSKTNPASEREQAIRFALIESFCVHSRSLIDFFVDKRTQSDDAVASDFANGFTGLDPSKEPVKSLRTKLNKQIFHLTKARKVAAAEKFDVGSDGMVILRLVEQEIVKFKACLMPDFQGFKCNTDPNFISSLPFACSTTSFVAATSMTGGPTGPVRRPPP